MNNPLVSIIIPTYNRADLLTETLDSVLAQTYQNWECLVIDDGSTENNVEIVNNYQKRDDRFKLFVRKKFNRPKGANSCRNIGIENAKGKYIIFLDSDDLMLKHCLESRIEFMELNQQFDFVVFQVETFTNENSKRMLITKVQNDYLAGFLSHNLPWQTSAPILKTELVKRNNHFDQNFPRLQDPDFFTNLLLVSNIKFKVLADIKPDVQYRILENKVNLTNILNGFKLYIEKYSFQLDKKGIFKFYSNNLKICFKKSFDFFQVYYNSPKQKKIMIEITFFALKERIINEKDFISIGLKTLFHYKNKST